jgi:hypothetical protein
MDTSFMATIGQLLVAIMDLIVAQIDGKGMVELLYGAGDNNKTASGMSLLDMQLFGTSKLGNMLQICMRGAVLFAKLLAGEVLGGVRAQWS